MAANGSGPIERYFQIVEMVAASHDGLTLTDIAQLTKLPKPTTHRLVRTLVELGILVSDETWYKMFRVGPRMWRMLHLGVDRNTVKTYSQIVVDELAARLGETAYVVRLAHDHVLSIARSVPDQGHRLHVLPGEHLPLHAASSAKAMLAFQDNATVRSRLHEPLERLTSHTHARVQDLLNELGNVRKLGYAICDREIDENVMAYSCPVPIEHIGVIYAIGVTGPVTRLREHPVEYWIEPMKAAAERLSAMLTTLEEH
ncbi:MAG: IclR family transcriptional regulator [Gemmatimonadales bacterium]|nr:IclR family transcriptional regulator [Gemmatimonadales bacterium]